MADVSWLSNGRAASDFGQGAVVRRNGLKCVKQYDDEQPWVMRRFGRFSNEQVDQWIAEGAAVEACCGQYGIGDHDPAEHGGS